MNAINNSRLKYKEFIQSCCLDEQTFLLTKNSEPSHYALCFAIFGYTLLREDDVISINSYRWAKKLTSTIRAVRSSYPDFLAISKNKPYLQLLTFTLSALKAIGMIHNDPLEDLVIEILPKNILHYLEECNVKEGSAGSGNYAMFIAVLLLHSRDFLGVNTNFQIKAWASYHMNSMNSLGFWGKKKSMTYLQFQNGYHQYEILEYLNLSGIPWQKAADNVSLLADPEGHFAPYPGGGGCYDYDAIFFLTSKSKSIDKHYNLLTKTLNTLLDEQNPDGGFCESKRIRPRSIANFYIALKHTFLFNKFARVERMRQFFTLLRPRHNIIRTHWSLYSRKWDESDLWDSWFRMLAIARIDVALNPENAKNWGFINYPGIGFHPSVRD